MVRLEHLSKAYKGRPALLDLSLQVAEGEIFGLLGHNGAGKSTTFGLMLGHLSPDTGEAFLGGHSVQAERAQALSRVGAIFETPAFYDYMTGWQNLRFFVSLSALVPDQRLRDIVELVGLAARIHDPVRAYSHGMRQRLALAQALLPDPSFVLLDEPTEGLDPEGIHEMREMIFKLRRERGITFMLSSHLLAEVEQLCDRVAILQAGKLVFCGAWQTNEALWELEVDDAARAASVLASLDLALNPPGRLALPPGRDIADVVDGLVRAGVRVRKIAPLHRTLEDFYLEHARP